VDQWEFSLCRVEKIVDKHIIDLGAKGEPNLVPIVYHFTHGDEFG